jgi:hypothetical protein
VWTGRLGQNAVFRSKRWCGFGGSDSACRNGRHDETSHFLHRRRLIELECCQVTRGSCGRLAWDGVAACGRAEEELARRRNIVAQDSH